MIEKWITAAWGEIPMVLVSAIVTYAAILLFTRVVGLRSFSKMTAVDFAMTVAVGSTFASIVSSGTPSLIVGLAALACLYLGQWALAYLRLKSSWFANLVDNKPMLLMAGHEFLEENLKQCNVTHEDIFGKLREANAVSYDQVLAVVFESTGDISVLHTSVDDQQLEPDFLTGVQDAHRVSGVNKSQ